MRVSIALLVGALLLLTTTAAQAAQPQRPVVVRVESGGFEWIDALIGAAAISGVALGLSGVIALYRRREQEDPLTRVSANGPHD